MKELFHEAIAPHNLPATVLLGLVIGYWLLVIIGALDSDSDAIDIDFDGDGIPDFSPEAHGLWASCGRFLHLGQVPFMIVLSFFSVSFWLLSLIGNYCLNGEADHRSLAVACGLAVPNFFVSMLVTRVVGTPIRKVFEAMERSSTDAEQVLAREGVVTSSCVDERHGQVEVQTKGAPLLIHARVPAGSRAIAKGEHVIIYEAVPEHAMFLVRPLALIESH